MREKKGTEKSRRTFNNREKERKEKEEEIKKKQEKKLNFSTRKKVLTFHYCSQIIIEPHNALVLEAISGKSQQRCLFQTSQGMKWTLFMFVCKYILGYSPFV